MRSSTSRIWDVYRCRKYLYVSIIYLNIFKVYHVHVCMYVCIYICVCVHNIHVINPHYISLLYHWNTCSTMGIWDSTPGESGKPSLSYPADSTGTDGRPESQWETCHVNFMAKWVVFFLCFSIPKLAAH